MSSMLQCFIPRPIFIGIQKWRIGSNSCLIQLAPCIWLPLSHFKRVNYQCTYYRIYSSIYNIYKGTTAPINVDPNSYMLFTAWRKMELWNLEKERGGQKGAKDSLFYHPPSIFGEATCNESVHLTMFIKSNLPIRIFVQFYNVCSSISVIYWCFCIYNLVNSNAC